jgi:hypothetical protein
VTLNGLGYLQFAEADGERVRHMVPQIDLDVQITPDRVYLDIEGEQPCDSEPRFDEETLKWLDQLRQENDPSHYGDQLHRCIFTTKVERAYRQARGTAERLGRRFRLRLDIHPEADVLQRLWWECLIDNESPPRALACYANSPLSRRLSIPGARWEREPVRSVKLNVLVAISDPRDVGVPGSRYAGLQRLDENAEVEVVRKALTGCGDRVHFEFVTEPASLRELRDRLTAGPIESDRGFHILHLVGYGVNDGEDGASVLLEDDSDDHFADPVNSQSFAALVAGLPELQLVVLAGCHTGSGGGDALVRMAPNLIQGDVPAVVTMNDQISTWAAPVFVEKFYTSLVQSKRTAGMVDVAINDARDAVRFRGARRDSTSWDWAAPVLFMRGSGRLFAPPDEDLSGEAGPRRYTMRTEAEAPLSSAAESRIFGIGPREPGTNNFYGPVFMGSASQVTEERYMTKDESVHVTVKGHGSVKGDIQGAHSTKVTQSSPIATDWNALVSELDRILATLDSAKATDPQAQLGMNELRQAKLLASVQQDPPVVKSRLDAAANFLGKSEGLLQQGLKVGELLAQALAFIGDIVP